MVVRTHRCTECGSHNTALCIKMGHLALCEVCERAFQIRSQGCTKHKYRDGHNIEFYNDTHRKDMWEPGQRIVDGKADDPEQPPDEEQTEADVDEDAEEDWRVFEAKKAAEKREAAEQRKTASSLRRSKSVKVGKSGKKMTMQQDDVVKP